MNSHCSSEFFEVLRVAVGLSRQSGTIVNRETASGCIVQVGGLRFCVAVSANGLTRPSRRSRPRCTRTRQEARCSLLSWRWSCLPQVYERGSDAAAVEESVLDLRWRTVLDLLVRCTSVRTFGSSDACIGYFALFAAVPYVACNVVRGCYSRCYRRCRT